ncbi:MAG: dihydrofolate reductase family protein [Micrococcales bacterium]|nr:dihydrofolate reductase family protein [Micrococcales bacterium]
MRTLAITQNITLDGAVEMIGDWFDPQGEANATAVWEELRSHQQASDAVLLGRETFESFRGYWRDLEDDPTGSSDHLNSVTKYVVSSTLADPDWAGTVVLDGADLVGAVTAIKSEPGKDIVVTGSISLCHDLIRADLVDEYRLFGYPVVQGEGRRLFPDGVTPHRLSLVEARPLGDAMVYSRYARA